MNLSEIIKSYKVFVDTSSLMHEHAGTFFHQKIYPELILTNTRIIVPDRVYKEIKKHLSSEDRQTQEQAKNAAIILQSLNQSNLVERRGDEEEVMGGSSTFADPVFLVKFTQFRQKYNLCLITQDTDLAAAIVNIKHTNAVTTDRDIKVIYISHNGYPGDWLYRLNKSKTQTSYDINQQKTNRNFSLSSKPFAICRSPSTEREIELSSGAIPQKGMFVFSNKHGRLELLDFISSGGEGEIFATNIPNLVCKIYKKGKLTSVRRKKLELMISRDISIDGVCWPLDIVKNHQGEFAGFIMSKARGVPLQTSVFVPALLNKKFPGWKREHLVILSLSVLDVIRKLHDLNVLIGDINPHNILVENENSVYFVDTDSYQVEGYPCPVGTVNFTARDIQGKNFSSFLRTKEHELFAVTTLIFMILFPGKPPYSSQGGGDLAQNIKTRNFSYVREENELDAKPFGPWRFIWSHLHGEMKRLFARVFQDGNTVPLDEISERLKQYLFASLKKGFSSNDIFPTTYKISAENGKIVLCNGCAKEELVSLLLLDKLKEHNKRFFCTRCRSLHKLRQNQAAYSTIQSSGNNSTSRSSTFSTQNQSTRNTTNNTSSNRHNTSSGQGKINKPEKKDECFIASAVYSSREDTSVVTLRLFRDKFLVGTWLGDELIELYYKISPNLAEYIRTKRHIRRLLKPFFDILVLLASRMIKS